MLIGVAVDITALTDMNVTGCLFASVSVCGSMIPRASPLIGPSHSGALKLKNKIHSDQGNTASSSKHVV